MRGHNRLIITYYSLFSSILLSHLALSFHTNQLVTVLNARQSLWICNTRIYFLYVCAFRRHEKEERKASFDGRLVSARFTPYRSSGCRFYFVSRAEAKLTVADRSTSYLVWLLVWDLCMADCYRINTASEKGCVRVWSAVTVWLTDWLNDLLTEWFTEIHTNWLTN
jgi:hypothetical protein